jgi:hypothetical protein
MLPGMTVLVYPSEGKCLLLPSNLAYPGTREQGEYTVFAIIQGQSEATHNKGVSVHVEESMSTYFPHSSGLSVK